MSFYNELRKNSASSSRRNSYSARSDSKQKPVLVNYEKREKLKQLLIAKFMKKYCLKTYDPLIEQEVALFLHKEVLSEKDLKSLDRKIDKILQKKQKLDNLAQTLNCKEVKGIPTLEDLRYDESKHHVQTAITDRRDYSNNDDCRSVKSGMSGGSKLSRAKPVKKELSESDIELLSVHEPIERMQFANEKDEWNAINKYNQLQFQQEKIQDKMKDQEIKRRVKEDLDNQIKQKMTRMNEERLKAKEYDKIAINHVEILNRIEQDRLRLIKESMLKEKENRDSQRLDEKKRRRIEELKSKKYDQELCNIYLINNISD